MLVDVTVTPQLFFNILPEDWQEGIVPFWNNYADSAKIFVLQNKHEIVAGGIVFSTVSPDTSGYAKKAQSWFNKGYLYIAFVYVIPSGRGKGFGSRWMEEIHEIYKGQDFWLSIEEFNLVKFYEPLGYSLREEVFLKNTKEWILARESAASST